MGRWLPDWVSSDHNIPKYLTLSTNHFNISYSPLVQYYNIKVGHHLDRECTRVLARVELHLDSSNWGSEPKSRFLVKRFSSLQEIYIKHLWTDLRVLNDCLPVHGLSICISLLALKLRLVRQYLQWLTIERIQTLLTSLRSNVGQ